MPDYFIRVDDNFMTRGELLDRLENQEWPEEFTIQGIVNANNPVSLSHTFHRIEGGYSFSTLQILFHPGLGAAGANQDVDFEHVHQGVINIINGFGPNAEAIINPPAADQVNGNIAADWDDFLGPEPVAPGPGFFDPELGHLPPLMAQQALGAAPLVPGALPMPVPNVPNPHPAPEPMPAHLPAFLPVLPIAPAAQQNQNNNNMNMNMNNNNNNNNNNMNMNYGGGRRNSMRRRTQRRGTQRRGTQRRGTQRRGTQRRGTQRRGTQRRKSLRKRAQRK